MPDLCQRPYHTSRGFQAELGNEVIVPWGTHGMRQKVIRAKVASMPYNVNYSDKTYDVNEAPRFVG